MLAGAFAGIAVRLSSMEITLEFSMGLLTGCIGTLRYVSGGFAQGTLFRLICFGIFYVSCRWLTIEFRNCRLACKSCIPQLEDSTQG